MTPKEDELMVDTSKDTVKREITAGDIRASFSFTVI